MDVIFETVHVGSIYWYVNKATNNRSYDQIIITDVCGGVFIANSLTDGSVQYQFSKKDLGRSLFSTLSAARG